MSLRKRLAVLGTIAALSAAGAGAGPAASPAIAKSCSAGYVHAVINGSHKCLRRGQFCSKPADRQYHRYGYHCHSGRLT